LNSMGIISLNYGGKNEAPLGDNSVLERARRPWGHSDSLRGKILFLRKVTNARTVTKPNKARMKETESNNHMKASREATDTKLMAQQRKGY